MLKSLSKLSHCLQNETPKVRTNVYTFFSFFSHYQVSHSRLCFFLNNIWLFLPKLVNLPKRKKKGIKSLKTVQTKNARGENLGHYGHQVFTRHAVTSGTRSPRFVLLPSEGPPGLSTISREVLGLIEKFFCFRSCLPAIK